MSAELEPVAVATPTPTAKPASAAANFAIAVCTEAWTRARKVALANNRGLNFADSEAAIAYRHAIPSLSCAEKVGEFIACVTHGMMIHAISPQEGARFLYAEQVASTVFRNQSTCKIPAAESGSSGA